MSGLVTFGETMLRFSPPANRRLEMTTELEVQAAGAESNVAAAANRLGVDATWISKLPDTPLGHRVTNELHKYGIDTEVVWSDEGRQGTYYLEHAGEPRGVNVIYDREDAAITTATASELPIDLIQNATAFYTSGITPALSDRLAETTGNCLKAAKEAGTKTALDVNYRSKLWSTEKAQNTLSKLFPLVDILITKTRDARELFGLDGSAAEIAHTFGSSYDFDTVVITRGEHGSLAWHDNVIHEQGIFEADTVDPIGTGDSFVGAFLARRMSGDSVGTALEYAAATASIKRTIPGDVAIVTQKEVENVIETGGESISR